MKNYLQSKIESLNIDQKSLYDDMLYNDLLQICIPTGAGKGYLMMVDLLAQIVSNKRSKIYTISTHRLMLNTQHLNDIFELLVPMFGKVGFIFVGSTTYNVNKFQSNPTLNKALIDSKLSYNEIISSTTNTAGVNELVKKHTDAGRKVVIMTTYHSLHTLKDLTIDTLYCDEAHTLASAEDMSKFHENFSTITKKRCYFFTATPKDCTDEETDSFLMNNEDIFGERVGIGFRQSVERGYLVQPIMHIATPINYDESYDYKSVDNLCKFILDSYDAHRKYIKDVSCFPDEIEPKILVKCGSVPEMWSLHKKLITMTDIKICSGASSNDGDRFNHYINNDGVTDRSDYLERLQKMSYLDKAIVLHYDTMSEGINVSGFTGVMFLGGKLPTILKTLQNVGRSTRLHPLDRKRLALGEIAVGDGNWVKPNCAVIIPYYDRESEYTAKEMAKKIKELRDRFDFNPAFEVSIGDDIADGKGSDDMEGLNKLDEKDRKTQLIEEIQHEIETLDNMVIEDKKLKSVMDMDIDEWIKFME